MLPLKPGTQTLELARSLSQRLGERGVLADSREPDIVRFAPAPIYTSFEHVERLGVILHELNPMNA